MLKRFLQFFQKEEHDEWEDDWEEDDLLDEVWDEEEENL